jgi:hypothetical protein
VLLIAKRAFILTYNIIVRMFTLSPLLNKDLHILTLDLGFWPRSNLSHWFPRLA